MSSRRGPAEWAVLIDEWRGSGLAPPVFCRGRKLDKATMSGWVYKPAFKSSVAAARCDPNQPRPQSTYQRRAGV
ncbi:MAG: hypothetical protein KGM43_05695 [Planctomycetota bacterium]|nr:hypothetical protein [Planctomycetota bacterium]